MKRKSYFYSCVLSNNDRYFIEQRNSGYYVCFESNDKTSYYTVYGGYKRLGIAENRIIDIFKRNNGIELHSAAIELLPKYLKPVYGI